MTGRHRRESDDEQDTRQASAPAGDGHARYPVDQDVAFTVEPVVADEHNGGRHAAAGRGAPGQGSQGRRRGRPAGDGAASATLPVEAAVLEPGTVRAEAVGYARGGRQILDAVSLDVPAGSSLAVVGPSGSGKSSLLALLAGLEQPDGGTVVRAPGTRDGLVLQGYGLVSVLSAAENVEAPLQAGRLGRLTPAEVRGRAAVVLDAVGLTPVADHLVEELSGGQQQRVAIARALAVAPAVLLADELTAELDHEWKDTVVRLVLDVAARGGVVVLATHDLELARRCDAVLRLVDGRVSA